MDNKCIVFIQKILFNSHCLLCSGPTNSNSNICAECEQDLPLIQSACHRCSSPLSTSSDGLCHRCQQNPGYIDTSHIPLVYETPVKELIHDFKFNANLTAGKTLADVFINSLNNEPYDLQQFPQVLIPIPLHRCKIRQRGFNQALFLARKISQATGINIAHNVLKKTRNTAAQHELSGKQRLKNLEGAFKLTQSIHYKHVALIDDVVTTTTTVNNVAAVLKQQGVLQVDVWAIARTSH